MRRRRRYWRRQLRHAEPWDADNHPIEVGCCVQVDLVGSGRDVVRVIAIHEMPAAKKAVAVCMLDSTVRPTYCSIVLDPV